MAECDHWWCYVHAVYDGPRNGTLIRKWCSKCKLELVGRVTEWRAPLPDEFDESAVEAAKTITAAAQSAE